MGVAEVCLKCGARSRIETLATSSEELLGLKREAARARGRG